MWRKDIAFTTIRHFMRDVVTIGGPIRGAPVRLKGEAAQFVEDALKGFVDSGVYERGASTWGSW
eukprot:8487013-Alexandrium_andersonii.AAC.1